MAGLGYGLISYRTAVRGAPHRQTACTSELYAEDFVHDRLRLRATETARCTAWDGRLRRGVLTVRYSGR
jgi:hypothetical protein